MISFPCKCGQIIEVPDDQAGLTVQCSHCGLLRDVPTLSDLSHITDDGTYDIEPSSQIAEEHRVDQVRRAFSKDRMDDEGGEIDLRPTMSDVKRAGYVEEVQDDTAPLIPKYDPVTGELVQPMKVSGDQTPDYQIPTAQRFISYATAQHQSAHYSGLKIFVELFQPMNVIVMAFILFAHAIWQGLLTLVSIPYFFMLAIIFLGITVMFFAHYAIVIEEIAVEERDELPRPLRQFEFLPDLFWPFLHFIGALFFAFWPAFFALNRLNGSPFQWPVFYGLVLLGFIFFPALLLTLVTSGTIRNIRPDRIVGVIMQSGARYFIAVILFPLVSALYLGGAIGVDRVVERSVHLIPPAHAWITSPMLVIPTLVIGVYMMHYFCWYLGLIYRDYHEVYPWVLQRHIPTRLLERTRT
jgi:hypothetical protein